MRSAHCGTTCLQARAATRSLRSTRSGSSHAGALCAVIDPGCFDRAQETIGAARCTLQGTADMIALLRQLQGATLRAPSTQPTIIITDASNACRDVAPPRGAPREWSQRAAQTIARLATDATQSERDAHHSEGHLALGDAYSYGLGVPVDRSKAAAHYAAVQAGPGPLYDTVARKQCAFNVGHAYQYGLGVPQDLHLAKRCDFHACCMLCPCP